MRVTVILTSREGGDQPWRAFERLRPQLSPGTEILLVSPHASARWIASEHDDPDKLRVVALRDRGEGKSPALNQALASATGDVFVLTDDDVTVSQGAIAALLRPFADPVVCLVTGRPLPTAVPPIGSMFGFWGHVLFAEAHRARLRAQETGQALEATGYLYAFRRGLIDRIPDDCRVEDAFVSLQVQRLPGARAAYAADATVMVTTPANWSDWFRQKLRTLSGSQQRHLSGYRRMRGFWQEAGASPGLLRYVRRPVHITWLSLLLAARLLAWVISSPLAWMAIAPESLWRPIQSTKPTPSPTAGAVFTVRSHDLPGFTAQTMVTCVIVATDGIAGVSVVARVPRPLPLETAIPSARRSPFDEPGWFVRFVYPLQAAQLVDYRGRCPADEFRRLLREIL